MADRIVLIPQGDDEARAREIIDAFAEETGLRAEELSDGGVEFPLGPDDHEIEVVQTLNDIDSDWPEYLAVGDPEGG
jgi:hypothetical protein